VAEDMLLAVIVAKDWISANSGHRSRFHWRLLMTPHQPFWESSLHSTSANWH